MFISGQTYTTQTGYNARGELTQYTYLDGTVVGRSYTHRGELHQLTRTGTTIDTRVYDNGGRQTTSTYNNGVVETRAYDTDNTLTSINFGDSGTAIGNLTYGWDNKTSETITGTMSNYGFTIPTNGYDNEDRLVSFNRTSGLNQSWNLSAVGDWNSVTTSRMGSQPVAEFRTHVSTSLAPSSSSLQPTASSPTHVYASYIDEPVLRWQTSGSTALYYHRNQQYSVYAVTNSSGAVQERYAYTAYGVPTIANASGSQISNSAISNRYLYTGREWDSVIHQYHYRARMYDASLGRFCSRDPIGYEDGWILFAQYHGLGSTDPEGLAVHSCKHLEAKFGSGLRELGENTGLPGITKRLMEVLKTTVKFEVYWNFRGSGLFQQTICTEDCKCNRSAQTLERKITARGELVFGITMPIGVVGSVGGEFNLRTDFALQHLEGGCSGKNYTRLCGTLSGGGQIKVCVGRRFAAEICVFAKLQCDIVNVCSGDTYGENGSPTQSGRCTLRIGGSACAINGLLCGEIDIYNGPFGLPF